jgi:ABC-type glutathione transport system ATPase component
LASVLVGNARWAEPPHLWLGVVGDSGTGKSPGADCLLGEILPEIERRMLADYPDRLREWFAQHELAKAAKLQWRRMDLHRESGEFL